MYKIALFVQCLSSICLTKRLYTSNAREGSDNNVREPLEEPSENGMKPLKKMAAVLLASDPALSFQVPPVSRGMGRVGASEAQQARLGDATMADDKAEVKEYFNNEGFDRWSRIYSEDGEVNKVQMDIREGHAQTVEKVLGWVDEDESAAGGETFGDAGCGVGSLSLPLAKRGAKVFASDISAAMVKEATQRAAQAGLSDNTEFVTSDLESIEGEYDTVTCIDVMIHYPEDKMASMVQGLASHAKKRLIISFAPNTWYYRALKKIGEMAPGPSKTTRAYLHADEAVQTAIKEAGFKITRTEMTGTNFYFSRLLEAVRPESDSPPKSDSPPESDSAPESDSPPE